VPISLQDVDSWLDIQIPGSDRPAAMHVLHSDADTGAAVSLVRFPAGWSRPEAGHYTPAEEFVVLDGALQVGRTHTAGDYVYLPPRTVRQPSSTEHGALVVAWFSATPTWVTGEPTRPPAGDIVVSRASGVLRAGAPEVPGTYEVGGSAPGPRPSDADVLDVAGRQWEWVPAGASANLVGPGQHTRTWN
jgi:hypothetical protein